MITEYLTQDEREKGARMLVWHSFFNGLGFGLLAETVIYLLALQFNPTNTQLGYISSAAHLAGLALFVLPQLTHGINLRKIYFAAWVARGSVAVIYFLTLFAEGQTAVSIILIAYTLFSIARIVGVAMAEPVQQMLATSTTRGMLVSRFFVSFQLAKLISQLISFGVTSFAPAGELVRLLVLIIIGIIANSISALYLLGIPYREKSRHQKGSGLITIFFQTLKNRELSLVVTIRCLTISAAVLIGFMIPFLRVVLELEQNMIFLFSLIGTLGMIVSGLILRPFVDTVGSKPLLTGAFIGQIISLVFWIFLAGSSSVAFILALGFMTTLLQATVVQLVARLVINTIPAKNKIGFTSMLNFITAIFAFITGFVGGYLIDLGEIINPAWGSSYSLAFLAGAAANLIAFILVLQLHDRGSLRIREAANILFSARNLRTFLDIYNFHLTDDPVKRQTILTAINYSPAPQAEPELRSILNNPIAPDKDQILISLYKNPRLRLLDLIIREALNADSASQRYAIFALGAYPQDESRVTLERLYRCKDAIISAEAAKSLARIGRPIDADELERKLIDRETPTRAMLNLMVALNVAGAETVYQSRLFFIIPEERGGYHQQSVLSLAAGLEGFTPPLDRLYAYENEESEGGIGVVLEEARSFQPFHEQNDRLLKLFADGDYRGIAIWCADILRELHRDKNPLALSLIDAPPGTVSRDDALGRLYFLFQLLNRAQQKSE